MAENSEKRAPVQGYSAGIPWAMHLRAYDAYCKRYSPQEALIQGGCRGGFSTGELDMFIPGWREELSTLAEQSATIARLERRVETLEAALSAIANSYLGDQTAEAQYVRCTYIAANALAGAQ